ncbi:thiamine pyrophosphate-dependent enzyme [Klebsiella variicola subsp. variicola]|nr:thiamine pyrophosphate-dependent enzyme [Klebsiella variicola subsp. variicola]
MPAAVGYSLGLGKAPVVCFVGDGAAMYSPSGSLDGRTRKTASHLYCHE